MILDGKRTLLLGSENIAGKGFQIPNTWFLRVVHLYVRVVHSISTSIAGREFQALITLGNVFPLNTTTSY
jgi:hypothetical protein